MSYHQLTFMDLADLADWLDQNTPPEEDVDTTPTDFEEPTTPPPLNVIESYIKSTLNHCTKTNTVLSEDQARAIWILDAINTKYN